MVIHGKKYKISKVLLMVLTTALVVLCVLFLGGVRTLAFVPFGKECGLRVETGGEPVDVTCLNPGDTKSSYLIVHNDGEQPFSYSFSMKRTKGTEGAGDLYGHMWLTVTYRGETIYEGPMADVSQLDMGSLAPGGSEEIHITIHLPGKESGNEYQGSTVTVNFVFQTECGELPYTGQWPLRLFHLLGILLLITGLILRSSNSIGKMLKKAIRAGRH